jgi:hypothetical protein
VNLFSFVPAWAWLAVGASLVTGAGVWHLMAGHDARTDGKTEGMAEVQALWDAATAAATLKAASDREKRAELALAASAEAEAYRAALAANLEDARHALQKALRRPISCPAGALLGDVVLPAAAMDGLRSASGAVRAKPNRPAPHEPSRAVH